MNDYIVVLPSHSAAELYIATFDLPPAEDTGESSFGYSDPLPQRANLFGFSGGCSPLFLRRFHWSMVYPDEDQALLCRIRDDDSLCSMCSAG